MKISKVERDRLRGLAQASRGGQAVVPPLKLIRLLDDADRAEELEERIAEDEGNRRRAWAIGNRP